MACGRRTLGRGRRGALGLVDYKESLQRLLGSAGVGVAESKGQKEIPRKETLDPGKTTPAAVAAQGTW